MVQTKLSVLILDIKINTIPHDILGKLEQNRTYNNSGTQIYIFTNSKSVNLHQ